MAIPYQDVPLKKKGNPQGTHIANKGPNVGQVVFNRGKQGKPATGAGRVPAGYQPPNPTTGKPGRDLNGYSVQSEPNPPYTGAPDVLNPLMPTTPGTTGGLQGVVGNIGKQGRNLVQAFRGASGGVKVGGVRRAAADFLAANPKGNEQQFIQQMYRNLSPQDFLAVREKMYTNPGAQDWAGVGENAPMVVGGKRGYAANTGGQVDQLFKRYYDAMHGGDKATANDLWKQIATMTDKRGIETYRNLNQFYNQYPDYPRIPRLTPDMKDQLAFGLMEGKFGGLENMEDWRWELDYGVNPSKLFGGSLPPAEYAEYMSSLGRGQEVLDYMRGRKAGAGTGEPGTGYYYQGMLNGYDPGRELAGGNFGSAGQRFWTDLTPAEQETYLANQGWTGNQGILDMLARSGDTFSIAANQLMPGYRDYSVARANYGTPQPGWASGTSGTDLSGVTDPYQAVSDWYMKQYPGTDPRFLHQAMSKFFDLSSPESIMATARAPAVGWTDNGLLAKASPEEYLRWQGNLNSSQMHGWGQYPGGNPYNVKPTGPTGSWVGTAANTGDPYGADRAILYQAQHRGWQGDPQQFMPEETGFKFSSTPEYEQHPYKYGLETWAQYADRQRDLGGRQTASSSGGGGDSVMGLGTGTPYGGGDDEGSSLYNAATSGNDESGSSSFTQGNSFSGGGGGGGGGGNSNFLIDTPQYIAGRRAAEDQLAMTLQQIGASRDEIPYLTKLLTERLQVDESTERGKMLGSLGERGLTGGVASTIQGDFSRGYDLERQNMAFDIAKQYADLANLEAGAHLDFTQALSELLLQNAADVAASTPLGQPGWMGTADVQNFATSGGGGGGGGKRRKPPKKRNKPKGRR